MLGTYKYGMDQVGIPCNYQSHKLKITTKIKETKLYSSHNGEDNFKLK